MRPIWFDALQDGHSGVLPAIPYHQMWEESAKWLPPLLLSLFSLRGTMPEERLARYFIHHVEFLGGKDKEDGGKYSVWHGMGKSRVEWLDELPVYGR